MSTWNFSGLIALIIYSVLPIAGWILLKKAVSSLKGLGMLTPSGVIESAKKMNKGFQESWAGGKATDKYRDMKSSRKAAKDEARAAEAQSPGAVKAQYDIDNVEGLRGAVNLDLRKAAAEGGTGFAAETAAARHSTYGASHPDVLARGGRLRMTPTEYDSNANKVRSNLGTGYADAHYLPDDWGSAIPVPHKGSVDTGPGLNSEDPTHWANYTDIDYKGFDSLDDQIKYQAMSAVGMTLGLRNPDGTDNDFHLDSLTPTQRQELSKGDVSVAAMVPRTTVSRAEFLEITKRHGLSLPQTS